MNINNTIPARCSFSEQEHQAYEDEVQEWASELQRRQEVDQEDNRTDSEYFSDSELSSNSNSLSDTDSVSSSDSAVYPYTCSDSSCSVCDYLIDDKGNNHSLETESSEAAVVEPKSSIGGGEFTVKDFLRMSSPEQALQRVALAQEILRNELHSDNFDFDFKNAFDVGQEIMHEILQTALPEVSDDFSALDNMAENGMNTLSSISNTPGITGINTIPFFTNNTTSRRSNVDRGPETNSSDLTWTQSQVGRASDSEYPSDSELVFSKCNSEYSVAWSSDSADYGSYVDSDSDSYVGSDSGLYDSLMDQEDDRRDSEYFSDSELSSIFDSSSDTESVYSNESADSSAIYCEYLMDDKENESLAEDPDNVVEGPYDEDDKQAPMSAAQIHISQVDGLRQRIKQDFQALFDLDFQNAFDVAQEIHKTMPEISDDSAFMTENEMNIMSSIPTISGIGIDTNPVSYTINVDSEELPVTNSIGLASTESQVERASNSELPCSLENLACLGIDENEQVLIEDTIDVVYITEESFGVFESSQQQVRTDLLRESDFFGEAQEDISFEIQERVRYEPSVWQDINEDDEQTLQRAILISQGDQPTLDFQALLDFDFQNAFDGGQEILHDTVQTIREFSSNAIANITTSMMNE